MTNYFEAVGELQARKVHERRVSAAKMEKETDDQHRQFNLYRKANRARLSALLANPIVGDKVKALMNFLKTLGPESAPVLVDYIENSNWLRSADIEVRIACLSYISMAIMRLRVQHGLPPFDDGVPGDGQPESAFLIIRKMLTGV